MPTKKASTTIHLALAIDEAYVQHACVVLASVFYHQVSERQIIIHILFTNLSKKSQDTLNGYVTKFPPVKMIFHNVGEYDFSRCPVDDITEMPHIKIPTYYRLVLASVLDKIDRVIYLDSDTVVKCDLTELYNTPLNGSLAAMTEDLLSKENAKRLNLSNYYNAGVMLIDLSAWRKYHIQEQFFAFVGKHHDEIVYVDQDVINSVLNNRIQALPKKYDLQVGPLPVSREYNTLALQQNGIIHWVGSNKPWNQWGWLLPYHHEYLFYLSKTPFKTNTIKIKIMHWWTKVTYNIKKIIKTILQTNVINDR